MRHPPRGACPQIAPCEISSSASDAFVAGAEALRQPLYTRTARMWRTMLALMDGGLASADRLAEAAVSFGMRSDGVAASRYHLLQLLAIRRELLFDRLAPFADTVVVLGVGGMCWGAVSRHLRLALLIGRHEQGIALPERAVVTNRSLRARALLAHRAAATLRDL